MAKHRTIADIDHVIYDSMEEFKLYNTEEMVNLHWRNGKEGEWVLADDGSVMQVLKFGKVSSLSPRDYIRTATGTYLIWEKGRLDSEFRENIYSFGGRFCSRTRLSHREQAFVSLIILGYNPVKAYLATFKTTNENIARRDAYNLITKEKIMTAIKEAVKKAGEDTGATLEWSMRTIKETVEDTDKPSVKIRGASIIAELHTKEKGGGLQEGGLGGGVFEGLRELPPPTEEPKQIEA